MSFVRSSLENCTSNTTKIKAYICPVNWQYATLPKLPHRHGRQLVARPLLSIYQVINNTTSPCVMLSIPPTWRRGFTLNQIRRRRWTRFGHAIWQHWQSTHSSGCHMATKEKENQRTPGKKIWRRCGQQDTSTAEEDGGAAENRAGWRRAVCGLCSTGIDKTNLPCPYSLRPPGQGPHALREAATSGQMTART